MFCSLERHKRPQQVSSTQLKAEEIFPSLTSTRASPLQESCAPRGVSQRSGSGELEDVRASAGQGDMDDYSTQIPLKVILFWTENVSHDGKSLRHPAADLPGTLT